MKLKNTILGLILKIFIPALFLTCISLTHANNPVPIPRLEAGTATLSGQIVDDREWSLLNGEFLSLFSARTIISEIPVGNNGFFSCEIPLETSVATVCIRSLFGYSEEYPIVLVEAGKETKVKIFRNEQDTMKIKIMKGPAFNLMHEDYKLYEDVLLQMLQLRNDPDYYCLTKDSLDRFLTDPMAYASYAIRLNLGARLKIAGEDTILSSQSKLYLSNTIKLLFAESLFRYPRAMTNIHRIVKEEGDTTTLNVPNPDRNYYTFLKAFDLNDPLYLYDTYLLNTLFQTLLRDQVLQIPRIEETPLEEWMVEVKAILADLVGFDEGLFYDLLIINAYSRQLTDEMRPLSEKQVKNLTSYYQGGEVEKLVLRKNKEIIVESKDIQPPTIIPIPEVPNEELLDTIISKYKGKIVVVDFWATWCAPCLKAMEKMRNLKKEMKDKEVVFVYFTNKSSPKELWNEKIQLIGGDHYYFSQKGQWETIMESLNFEVIPSYVIFDQNGEMAERFEGYPGNNIFEAIIETLLKNK